MNDRHRRSARPSRLVRLLAAGCVSSAAIAAAGNDVAVFPAASDSSRQGFIRIVNHGDRTGEVRIGAIDDAGIRRGPLVLSIDANEAVHLNSDDVENGNTAKGLDAGVGSGSGDWRLELTSDLDIEVLAYVRTPDGYLTSVHEVVAADADGHYHIGFFNPGDASKLRVVNHGEEAANVTITGVDDHGETPGTGVEVPIAAGGSRTLAAEDLETGGDGLTGNLGNGTGKWRLSVSADQRVTIVNLLEGPAGLLSNLSSVPRGPRLDEAHDVPLFPGSSNPHWQGFVRVINHSDAEASIDIDASDASGRDYGTLTLTVDANAAVQFDTDDLELGNAEAGLSAGVGAGEGDWRLALSSDHDIEVLAFIRPEDGFPTPMHAIVPAVGQRHRVSVFNPASNRAQVSRLRLENRGTATAKVSIKGIDDRGTSPGRGIELSLAGGQTRTLTADDLETGSLGLDGDIGDGAGKWQLIVESDTPISVMNLMANPTGHLTNLSGVSATTAPAHTSAFNSRAVGKRIVQEDASRYIDLLAEDQYRETRARETTTGSYSYSSTSPTTASLSLTADDGGSCQTELIFETRVSGRLSGCGEAETELSWRLLEPTRQEGDRVVHEITATVEPLGSEVPEVLRGAITSDGVRVDFDNGGYVEMGAHRYTCRNGAGCVVDNGVVTRGRIVQTPALGARDFDVLRANRSPAGLAYASGHFRVVDVPDRRVYAYDASGVHAPALDFDLAADNRMPGGIAVEDNRFYVVDEGDFLDSRAPRQVFVYDSAGQHQADDDFELDSTIRVPLGIASFNDRLFLAGARTRRVYAYRFSGEPDSDADFDLDPDNVSPRGVAYSNGRFFVVDTHRDKVYAYLTSGVRDPLADFQLVDGNSLPRGITYVDDRFFVADADRVFAYPADRPDLVVDSFWIDDTRPDAGATFAMNITVRNIGHRRAAETTLRYYRSADATIHRTDEEVGHTALDAFDVARTERLTHRLKAPTRAGFYQYGVCIDALPDEYEHRNCSNALEVAVPVDIKGPTVGFALDAENRNPTGIVYANGRFFVLDAQDDHVYAYRTSAARDADSDFPLHADNSRPATFAYANRGFYVVDVDDDKVYAYTLAGERDADADFALDSDNGNPWAIEYANSRFYVADRSDRRVYVYGRSGERHPSADFDLYVGNTTPLGIAFAKERLFVVDLFDDHVYAYTTAGERDSAVEFNLVPDNGSPQGITLANGRLYIADSTDSTVYGYAIPAVADLTVDTAAVSDDSPGAGASFTFTATVRNLGDGRSPSAGVRYYLASDSAYETSESLAGTGSVGALDPAAAQDVSFEMTAPTDDGCYFCGACVSVVHGERVRSNNCATPAEILLGDGPDMDVSRLGFYTGGVGDPVEVQIGVINRGVGTSLPGKLRVTGGDDVVLDIPALAPNEEKVYERHQIGTGRSGYTTYEMCIDVPCEEDPEDNCRTRSVTL